VFVEISSTDNPGSQGCEEPRGDPLVYISVTILVGLVTLVASFVPARRAASIDPVTALRQE
jgi:hypothetical protein